MDSHDDNTDETDVTLGTGGTSGTGGTGGTGATDQTDGTDQIDGTDEAGDEFETCLDAARGLLTLNEDADDLWEANDLCNRALTARPDSAEAWLVKGQVNSALGDDHSALACIEMSLVRDRHQAETHYWLMAVYADLERFEDALEASDRAFAAIGDDDDWLLEEIFFEKGAVLDSMGDHEAALSTFEAGLARCPDSALLLSGLQPLHRARLRRSFKVIPGGLS